MSKKDKVKENISIHKAFLMLFVTSIFGIVGYAMINMNKLENNQIWVGGIVIVALLVGSYFIHRKYKKLVDYLGDLVSFHTYKSSINFFFRIFYIRI
ncbi:hypothetical protein [Helicobacter saguini]|uniref:Uncharacterized protein n=1 Tax=Helicobacter saguini TaxID=1548018 RepID=A0A6B0HXR2_9HELI|nr:hypothetical protein [Helicobacter saguini]MWV61760.1 hypothetical protein [Helicobacter saguini]MWV69918.1 hypothetical protein [Helicobacter saguini]MWV72867.1 hypothetical protein [Helicobacter saguini]